MSKVIHRFNLDLHSSQSQISIPVQLQDSARAFHITLSEGGKPYFLEDGSLVTLTVQHPSGETNFVFECTILNNTTVVHDFAEIFDPVTATYAYTAAVVGTNRCELTICNPDGEIVASPKFTMVVHNRVTPRSMPLAGGNQLLLDGILTTEKLRIKAEDDRIKAEDDRIKAEDARIEAEDARRLFEIERDKAEGKRIEAEIEREEAETARQKAEAERESKFVTPEQYGAVGDGETDDSAAFQTMFDENKSNGKTIRLTGSYYIGKSVVVPNDSMYTIVGKHVPQGYAYAEMADIVVDKNNDTFVGANHSKNQRTKTSWNVTGVKFTSKEVGSTATVFKDIMFIGTTFTDCIAEMIFAFLEGSFDFISSLVRLKTINIRNFFMSDYVFNEPVYMKDLRQMTYPDFSTKVRSYQYVNGDNPNLFDGCYFNGYNPASTISSKDLPCFYLTHYCDFENYGKNCFLDYWYAIEECLRSGGSRNSIRWRDSIFQNSVYFFANNNADTATANGLGNFMLDGCQLFGFGVDNDRLSDYADYENALLTSEPLMLKNAMITNNVVHSYSNKLENMRFEFKSNEGTSVFSQGNRAESKSQSGTQIGITHCLIKKSTTALDYFVGVLENSYIQELDMKLYEVNSVPTTIKRNSYSNTVYDWLFVGRRFVFKAPKTEGGVNAFEYHLRTLVPAYDPDDENDTKNAFQFV